MEIYAYGSRGSTLTLDSGSPTSTTTSEIKNLHHGHILRYLLRWQLPGRRKNLGTKTTNSQYELYSTITLPYMNQIVKLPLIFVTKHKT